MEIDGQSIPHIPSVAPRTYVVVRWARSTCLAAGRWLQPSLPGACESPAWIEPPDFVLTCLSVALWCAMKNVDKQVSALVQRFLLIYARLTLTKSKRPEPLPVPAPPSVCVYLRRIWHCFRCVGSGKGYISLCCSVISLAIIFRRLRRRS